MCNAGADAGVSALNRFIEAQDRPAGGSTIYDSALTELRAGRKSSHWIWFVFPQIDGVAEWYGAKPSATARHFAIVDSSEAEAFADHPVLGARLNIAFRATAESDEADPVRLMGGIDAAKLKSSATLFSESAGAKASALSVLDTLYGGETCPATTAILAR